MSSLDTDDEAIENDDTDAAWGRARTRWEIQEIVAAPLLGGIAVLAVTGVVSGVIDFQSGHFFAAPAGQEIIESTQWAGLLTAFVLLCAVALVWWQVDGWTEALDDLGDDRSGPDDDDESVALEVHEAQRHLRRNRRLATWAGVSLVVAATAAVALVVGVVTQQTPVEPSALDWNEIVSFSGQSLAAIILAGAGLYGARLVRRQCDDTLAPPPTAAAGKA